MNLFLNRSCSVRRQNESWAVWYLAVIGVFVILLLKCSGLDITYDADAHFLYNRCYQMWDCIRHGYWPFLYYNDLGGIGYGSPIFYGQLTLLPFVPFLFDKTVFMYAYFIVSGLVNFFGFRFLCKRFSSYATLSSCVFMFGLVNVFMWRGSMHAGVLAVGISWFFFGACVDFFRDGGHLALVTLLYFLIWQTNFNFVVLSLVGCFVIFVCYFDIRRCVDYLVLFLSCLSVLLFDILNILVHADVLRDVDVNLLFGDLCYELSAVTSKTPVGGFLYRSLFGSADMCSGAVQFAILFLFVYFLQRGFGSQSMRFKGYAYFFLACFVGVYIVGMWTIWPSLYENLPLFFQFPMRPLIFLWGALVIVLSRVIYTKRFVIVTLAICLVDIFVCQPLATAVPEAWVEPPYIAMQMINGEFASNAFVMDYVVYEEYSSSVVSESGVSYGYVNEYNGLSVDCSANQGVDVLTLPKLYYRWYRAYGDGGLEFAVKPGYSNYCLVDIGDYFGTLRLVYEVPAYMLILFALQVCCVCVLCCLCIKSASWKKFLLLVKK